jgi:hypothetical protein
VPSVLSREVVRAAMDAIDLPCKTARVGVGQLADIIFMSDARINPDRAPIRPAYAGIRENDWRGLDAGNSPNVPKRRILPALSCCACCEGTGDSSSSRRVVSPASFLLIRSAVKFEGPCGARNMDTVMPGVSPPVNTQLAERGFPWSYGCARARYGTDRDTVWRVVLLRILPLSPIRSLLVQS